MHHELGNFMLHKLKKTSEDDGQMIYKKLFLRLWMQFLLKKLENLQINLLNI